MTATGLKKAGAVILMAAAAGLAGFLILDARFRLPDPAPDPSCVVLAKDGTPLRAFAGTRGVWRYPVTLDAVPADYIQALLTYEDRWFYYHPGVNPFAVIRALAQNLASGRIVSGGSTLTMQVARLTDPCEKSVSGKLKQMFRALQLEWHYTKDEILTMYVNMAPFGSNIEGLQAAAFTWLGKPAGMLSRAEAALLAVLPQAPSRYRPDRHPDRAQRARDKVLDRLARYRIWPPDDIAAAKKEPVTALRATPPVTAPLLARRLYLDSRQSARPPSVIQTCIDYDRQLHVESILSDYIRALPPRQSGAVLVVNIRTMAVEAYAGSADFSDASRAGHVDMVRALRSPGSTLKPFLYGFALDAGLIHSHSLLLDTPRFRQDYDPGNFSSGFMGPVSAARALRLSLNIPAVQLLDAFGPREFHDRLKNGMARLALHDHPNLSIVLGGIGTDLESIVTLYSALSRQGLAAVPRVTPEAPVHDRHLMSPGAAWIVREILAQPLPGYEGISRLSSQTPVAWKTGTSYGFRDAWAVGLMGDYAVGVWIGRPDGTPCPGQYGALTAVPLLQRVISCLPAGRFSARKPESVTTATVCWPLGYERSRFPDACYMQHQAWILNGLVPPTLPDPLSDSGLLLKTVWLDGNGNRASPVCGGVVHKTIALWPKSLDPWLPRHWKRQTLIPEPSAGCPDLPPLSGNRVTITGITDRGLLTRPPGRSSPPMIPLTALGGTGDQVWFLNQKPVARIRSGLSAAIAMPPAGAYQLAVLDESGTCDMIRFQVVTPASGPVVQ